MQYVFNYINLDIRILHTLMYQVDLCYTDNDLRDPSEIRNGFQEKCKKPRDFFE